MRASAQTPYKNRGDEHGHRVISTPSISRALGSRPAPRELKTREGWVTSSLASRKVTGNATAATFRSFTHPNQEIKPAESGTLKIASRRGRMRTNSPTQSRAE
jgi:hypothetical protein